jgi:hypothetical protein
MVREEVPGESRRRELEHIFMMSSRLERMFWEMAYTFEQWPDLRWLSLGFNLDSRYIRV